MVIKHIAKLCKKTGTVRLWDDEDRDVQWISNGQAAWPLYGMPYLDADNVLTALDIPEKDWDKITVKEMEQPESLGFDDIPDGEKALRDPALTIIFGGRVAMPIETSEGLALIDPELLRPLKDVSQLTLHERRSTLGELYLAAKGGMLLQGILLPLNPKIFEPLPELLNAAADGLSRSLSLRREQEEEAEDQYRIDPETGEVVEK